MQVSTNIAVIQFSSFKTQPTGVGKIAFLTVNLNLEFI